jgi:molybdate transport system substrate-binding protein
MTMLWGVLLFGGCGGSDASGERTLTVLAASSLADVTESWEAAFEDAHPGVDVQRSHAGSQTLATQIRHGIAADVFASADPAHVEALAAEGRVGPGRPFAANTLVLVVRADLQVGLADLPTHDLSLVVGGPEVPLGRYTQHVFQAAEERFGPDWRTGVEARVASREPNARLVVAKVGLGEADAAFAYRTDVAGVDGVRTVELDGLSPMATYVHTVVTGAPEPELASAWLDFVDSEAGRAILSRHGFSKP